MVLIPFSPSTLQLIVHRCGSGSSMHACHTAGQVSWVRFFRGFSSPVRQISGTFRPTRSPNIIWPPLSSFRIRLVGMIECVSGVYCVSCLCCLGGGPGIELITHPRRPSMSLCGQKSMYVIQSLIPLPRQVVAL